MTTLTKKVTVNRTRPPQDALKATGRTQYVTDSVVASMPKGTGKKVEVEFFKVGKRVIDSELEKEYANRGLVPVDPYSLAAVNEADLAFADEHPNATHWKDEQGKWCYAAFPQWCVVGRLVYVYRNDVGWRDGWWFGGLRKKDSAPQPSALDTVNLELPEVLEVNGVKYKKI